jgi:uncharacterized protein YeaO (DUF488 family)
MVEPSALPGTGREVRISSVYEAPSADGGTRILVDLDWPPGLSRTAARIQEWFPMVAPSPDLQRSFARRRIDFAEFRRRYLVELGEPLHALAVACLRQAARRGTFTLLTADEDTGRNHAAVLAERLRSIEVRSPGQAGRRLALGAPAP